MSPCPELRDVYGITFYRGERHKYVFLSDKKGRIQQWMFGLKGDLPDLKLLRTLKVKSIVEGMVADEYYGKLYFAEENVGLWEVNAHPWKAEAFQLLIATDNDQLLADFEGVTLMERPDGEGMIFISIQGNNAYGIVDRKSKKFLGGFRIGNFNGVDAVEDTDGIDLSTFSSGLFPQGIFIAQDGDNGTENQNYKLVDLGLILDYISPKP
ncbi:MAG: phytase [Bacteroidetes bacterium]|nr:phytase [Bacteroidota bacterium]